MIYLNGGISKWWYTLMVACLDVCIQFKVVKQYKSLIDESLADFLSPFSQH